LVNWEKQTQSKPIKAKTNPIQTQLLQRPKMMQSEYLQGIKRKMRIGAIKKQSQNKPNFKIPDRIYSLNSSENAYNANGSKCKRLDRQNILT
jgi:hypothetical protein